MQFGRKPEDDLIKWFLLVLAQRKRLSSARAGQHGGEKKKKKKNMQCLLFLPNVLADKWMILMSGQKCWTPQRYCIF